MFTEFEDDTFRPRGWLDEEIPQNNFNFEESEDITKRKIYIGFGTKFLNKNQIHEYFVSFGQIETIQIIKDSFGNRRGYAFVTFCRESSVEKVLSCKSHNICGVCVEISRAHCQDAKRESFMPVLSKNKIFIGGLPKIVTKQQINEVFQSHFARDSNFRIEEIFIPFDKTGQAKGFSFVTFNNSVIVDEIISKYPRIEICGRMCEVKRAEPREDEINASVPSHLSHKPATSRLGGMRLTASVTENVASGRSSTTLYDDSEPRKVLSERLDIPNSFFPTRAVSKSKPPRVVSKISDTLDHATLVNIGRICVDSFAESINDSESSDPADYPVHSLLIQTLFKIISKGQKFKNN